MGYNRESEQGKSVHGFSQYKRKNKWSEWVWKKRCHKEYPVRELAQYQIILLWNVILQKFVNFFCQSQIWDLTEPHTAWHMKPEEKLGERRYSWQIWLNSFLFFDSVPVFPFPSSKCFLFLIHFGEFLFNISFFVCVVFFFVIVFCLFVFFVCFVFFLLSISQPHNLLKVGTIGLSMQESFAKIKIILQRSRK